jgi:hypothetical protein
VGDISMFDDDVGSSSSEFESQLEVLDASDSELGGKVQIVIDDVAINQTKAIYQRSISWLVTLTWLESCSQKSGKLANKLLMFAINGLSHSYCIGYFLVANLKAEGKAIISFHTEAARETKKPFTASAKTNQETIGANKN